MIHEVIATLSKGLQVTIPAEFRKFFRLSAGSRMEMSRQGNKIILKPVSDELEELFANAKNVKPKHNLSAKQMDELIENELLGR